MNQPLIVHHALPWESRWEGDAAEDEEPLCLPAAPLPDAPDDLVLHPSVLTVGRRAAVAHLDGVCRLSRQLVLSLATTVTKFTNKAYASIVSGPSKSHPTFLAVLRFLHLLGALLPSYFFSVVLRSAGHVNRRHIITTRPRFRRARRSTCT